MRIRYGAAVALDVARLRIRPGEAVALVGPSGAGKTTLLKTLGASLRPSAGTVEVGGNRLSELSPRELRALRAELGFVHQDLCLIPNLSVLQNVAAGRLGRWSLMKSLGALLVPNRGLADEVHALLERVGIGDKLYQRVDYLSGGERQRVAIARALFQRPSALLADEPVSSVDPARARATVSLLVDLCREEGITLCTSLHNVALAREFFPRLVGLRGGRVEFDSDDGAATDGDFESLYAFEADTLA